MFHFFFTCNLTFQNIFSFCNYTILEMISVCLAEKSLAQSQGPLSLSDNAFLNCDESVSELWLWERMRCCKSSLKLRTAGLQGGELKGGAVFIVHTVTLWSFSSGSKFFFWAQEVGRTTDAQACAGLSLLIPLQRVTH